MKSYIDKILNKEKKAISLERLISKIEDVISLEKGEDVKLSEQERKDVYNILEEGVEKYEIFKTPSDNYINMLKTSFRKGRFYADKTGAGKVSITTTYVDRDGNVVVNEDKVDIGRDKTGGAIDGDFVLVDIGGRKIPPKIEKVIDRKLDYIPGEVYSIGSSYFVKPIDKKKQSLIIALEEPAVEGERVAVSLDKPVSNNYYIGKVVKKFNHKDDPNQEILWEAFKHGVDNDFSDEALEQLEDIPDVVRDIDKIGREDFTNWTIFTIDGEDTKDMDDAISCTVNENGNYVLGVHITDVASIIPEDSPLDKEAFRKGNSYYLGGCVLPMTPHKISNGIGSLNPNVERMAVSCIMEISPEGKIINYRITPSIIKSRLKMSYTKVNEILKEGKVSPEYKEFADTLRLMNILALQLRKNRLKKGAIEFDRSDIKVLYGEDGKITDFSIRTQDVAENLIEEFMLIANETVDKDLSRRGLPCVHRIHGNPNEEKVIELLRFLDAINLPFESCSPDEIVSSRKAYQKLVKHISTTNRLSNLLATEAIKCMSRAKYSPDNIGHFGLAKDNYCHFTSPVRRYSDLTVHRILWDCVFNKEKSKENKTKWINKLPEIAEKTTHMEKVSDETERDVLRMLYAGYLEDHIGEEFNATVTCVSKDCLTVELDNLIEGTVRVKDLPGNYVHSPESYSLVSLDNEDNYYIGDRVRLKLKSSSKETRKIDFTVIEKINETDIVNSNEINRAVKIKAKNEMNKEQNRRRKRNK